MRGPHNDNEPRIWRVAMSDGAGLLLLWLAGLILLGAVTVVARL